MYTYQHEQKLKVPVIMNFYMKQEAVKNNQCRYQAITPVFEKTLDCVKAIDSST